MMRCIRSDRERDSRDSQSIAFPRLAIVWLMMQRTACIGSAGTCCICLPSLPFPRRRPLGEVKVVRSLSGGHHRQPDVRPFVWNKDRKQKTHRQTSTTSTRCGHDASARGINILFFQTGRPHVADSVSNQTPHTDAPLEIERV
jgi:hypothetical protein